MYVLKRNGEKEEVKFDKITARIRRLCFGLNPEYVDAVRATPNVSCIMHVWSLALMRSLIAGENFTEGGPGRVPGSYHVGA